MPDSMAGSDSFHWWLRGRWRSCRRGASTTGCSNGRRISSWSNWYIHSASWSTCWGVPRSLRPQLIAAIEVAPDVVFHEGASSSTLQSAQGHAQWAFGASFPVWQVTAVCDDGMAVIDCVRNSISACKRTRFLEAGDIALSLASQGAALLGQSIAGIGRYLGSQLRLVPRSDAFFRGVGGPGHSGRLGRDRIAGRGDARCQARVHLDRLHAGALAASGLSRLVPAGWMSLDPSLRLYPAGAGRVPGGEERVVIDAARRPGRRSGRRPPGWPRRGHLATTCRPCCRAAPLRSSRDSIRPTACGRRTGSSRTPCPARRSRPVSPQRGRRRESPEPASRSR